MCSTCQVLAGLLVAVLISTGAQAERTQYPIAVTNCGITRTYDRAPKRAVSLNQGPTEVLLALGLETSIVGTAYLDDFIWPKYKAVYDKVGAMRCTNCLLGF